jgi:hypothetical protein
MQPVTPAQAIELEITIEELESRIAPDGGKTSAFMPGPAIVTSSRR